tara:strand:+ start:3534 stop:5039 length:1506 start_codon:yes stop_codon:yes gene_type:complete
MNTFLQNIGFLDTHSLYQGHELKQYINNYTKTTNIEHMDTQSNQDLQQLDIKFKDLLSKYTQALHAVNEEILKNTKPVNYNLLGKRFVTNNVDMYINPYGYGHTYTSDLEENPTCPSKTDIFNNSCQGFSDTYLTKSKGGNNYMYFKDYKLKEGFEDNTLLDKLKSCKDEDLNNFKINFKEYLMLHQPDNKITDKLIDTYYNTRKKICERNNKKASNYTLEGAKFHCDKQTGCKGFTFTGNPTDSNPTTFSTKANINDLQYNNNWHTYLKGGDWGCAPEFSKQWWIQNKCTTNPKKNTSICNADLKSIKLGYNMTNNIPCNIAGKLVRNTQDNELAWVDMQGIKHVFPDINMQDKLDGCNTKVTISLQPNEYNAIPLGDPMTKESICQHINVDDKKYKRLLNLNKQLEIVANKILLKLDSVAGDDLNKEKNIMSKKSSIKSLLNKIKKERKIIDNKKQNANIIYKQQEDSHTLYMSNNYHMIAWGLLVLAITGFSIPVLLK